MAFSMHICGPKMIAGNETIADVFAAQLDSNVGLFGIDCSVGVEYGYPRLKTDVFAIAAALQLRDLGPGDVVMVTDYGSYEAQTVLLAGLLVGATVAALDYTLKRETLASLVDRSKPDVVFCGAPDAVAAMSDALETIAHRPTLKISLAGRDGFAAYSDVVATAGGPFARPAKSAAASKYRPPCAIIYSSGTTGVPKGIHLSDHALKSALMSFKRLMEEPDENRFMTTSPAFWYTGMLLLLLGVHYGKPRLFFSARPTAQRILSSIHQYKPTFLMTGVAAINEMMYCQMADGHRRHDIDSLTTVVVGGSPMRPDLQRTITERLLRGRIPIKQGYGATEQGIIATWTTESDVRTVVDGCVGRPAPGVKIKIVSLETGECAGPDADGEIRVKSVSDMIGYVCDVKATVNSYDEDGWFKTGDVGHYTDDGRLFVVGRIKELMVYNGLRIAPTDVETVLLSHRAVLDAGVTSRDGPHGDLLVGVVRVKPDGGHVEADQLVAYVKSKVKDHEQLRGGVIFVDDVPRSPAGKLKRDELKRLVK